MCVCGNTIGFTDLLFSSLIFFGVVIFYLSLAQPHSVIFSISSMSCPRNSQGTLLFQKPDLFTWLSYGEMSAENNSISFRVFKGKDIFDVV